MITAICSNCKGSGEKILYLDGRARRCDCRCKKCADTGSFRVVGGRRITCRQCGGKGKRKSLFLWHRCTACDGKGQVVCDVCNGSGFDPECKKCRGRGTLVGVCETCKGQGSFNLYFLPIKENAFETGSSAYRTKIEPYRKIRTGAQVEQALARLRSEAPANAERPLIFKQDHVAWSNFVSIAYYIYRISDDGFVIQRTNPGSGGEGDVGEY
jgi:hypothetical protein